MWPLVGLAHAHVGALASDDGRERVDDGHERDDERHDDRCEAGHASHVEQRYRAQGKAEEQRAGVTEEDGRRVEVVAQEAERGAGNGDGDGGGVEPAGLRGQKEQRAARYERDARGQAVEPVDEVDDVHIGNEVYDRHGARHPAELDLARGKRVDDGAHGEAGHDGNDGGQDLARKLCERLELHDVVNGPGEKDHEERDAKQRVVDGGEPAGREYAGPAEPSGAHDLDRRRGDEREEDGRCRPCGESSSC